MDRSEDNPSKECFVWRVIACMFSVASDHMHICWVLLGIIKGVAKKVNFKICMYPISQLL